MASPRLRCAVYTRKSTDEGLNQEFNSLDAQREACIAYISSQAGLGWNLIADRYDDGGISGGTMERPALQRLLQDIRDRKVDVVVVYKIDRLTRSLMDFSKIVEIFDGHGVSFVSVTQQFNTTTSMGRLTLNVLLSFAQFEREVTAERIRDKIAASKKKGMWMGGVVPLGYKVENRKLLIEHQEAETVRHLFKRYLDLRSVRALSNEAISSSLTGRAGIGQRSGQPFGRGNLYHLLSNPIYCGKIRHRDKVYDGEHEPIIDQEIFDQAQRLLAEQAPPRRSASNVGGNHLLTGLIFDETGSLLRSVHANKKGKRYRYYISKDLVDKCRNGKDGWRLPADELESVVEAALIQILHNPAQLSDLIHGLIPAAGLPDAIEGSVQIASNWNERTIIERRAIITRLIDRIDLQSAQLRIRLRRGAIAELVSAGSMRNGSGDTGEQHATITCPISLRRRGVETKLILNGSAAPHRSPDASLIYLIARAHAYLDDLSSGVCDSLTEIAGKHRTPLSEISRILPFAFLSPKIIEAIATGRQPVDLSTQRLLCLGQLPTSWSEQEILLGF
ncbi:MAG: recombinase family protein [Rhizobiaceae bacterium]|nr:recombinase family protein [Rhizobiaceae bacterium]